MWLFHFKVMNSVGLLFFETRDKLRLSSRSQKNLSVFPFLLTMHAICY